MMGRITNESFDEYNEIPHQEYNNLKLVLKEEKTYKKLFCRYFNILDNSIIYDTEISSNNLCIIPLLFYLLLKGSIASVKSKTRRFEEFWENASHEGIRAKTKQNTKNFLKIVIVQSTSRNMACLAGFSWIFNRNFMFTN